MKHRSIPTRFSGFYLASREFIRGGGVPGPKGLPLLGSAREAQRDPLRFFLNLRRTYGDVARFRIGPRTSHLIAHPDGVHHVLQENYKNYRKSRIYEFTRPLLGLGLLTSDGEFWRRQRRIAQPAFHRKRIENYAATMTGAALAMLERWQQRDEHGAPLDVAAEMTRLTAAIVGRTLFSHDVSDSSDAVGAALAYAQEHISGRMSNPFALPARVPTVANVRFNRAITTLDDIVGRMIAERRRSGLDSGDLLSMLMFTQDEETGERMNDRQLRDEAMTLFLAGHETTANALSWFWFCMSKHPAEERRLHDELDRVLGGRVPGVADLPQLVYTRMAIEETLRLFPPAWAVGRSVLADDMIGGHRIPAGSLVSISPFVTHRHPEFWDNPEGFDPERFTPERAEGRHRFAYFPFSMGPRQCIGNTFAMMEAMLLVATIAQRYRIELVPGHPIVPEPLLSLGPKYGVLAVLKRRA